MWNCLVLSLTLPIMCGGELMDLTHEFNGDTPYWPNGQVAFTLRTLIKGESPQGIWVFSDEYSSGVHGGTHMDAPEHFFVDGSSVSQIPVENFIAPAIVIDIRQAASQNPDTNLTLGDVENWENQYGRVPDGAVVLQCSGWSDWYPNKTAYFGNDRDDTSDFHFPSFSLEAVEWLVTERRIVGISVDTPSIDYGQSSSFSVHIYTSSHGVYGLENVKGPCEVPAAGATLYAFPSKLGGASGAPVRIVAKWDNNSSTASVIAYINTFVMFIVSLFSLIL